MFLPESISGQALLWTVYGMEMPLLLGLSGLGWVGWGCTPEALPTDHITRSPRLSVEARILVMRRFYGGCGYGGEVY